MNSIKKISCGIFVDENNSETNDKINEETSSEETSSEKTNSEETSSEETNEKKVLISILARNKGHVLPRFFRCLDELDYDKSKIVVYINTNNNIDDTVEVLEKWIEENDDKYMKVDYENSNVDELENTTTYPHEWTSLRFKKLGEIRNRSLRKTIEYNCDYYFVIDCDNFIEPYTLKDLIKENKEIIAPMLVAFPEKNDNYSNYFCDISPNGYYKHNSDYIEILEREIVGTFEVPVVHCTYLIKQNVIDKLGYMDETDHHEFVIFSRNARNNNIKQWICNNRYYGRLVHFYDETLATLTLEEEKKKLESFSLE